MTKTSSAPALLLGTGFCLGINFPLGKLALAAGVTAPLWAAFIALGAGLSLLAIASLTEGAPRLNWPLARFAVISGFLSYVIPNLLTFTVIPKLGSGYAGLMFSLSPVATAAASLALNVNPPRRLELFGLAVGLLGALVIIWGKGGSAGDGASLWLLLALAVPASLAIGNVYRSIAWPKKAGPRLLGSLTNLAAAPCLLLADGVLNGRITLAPFATIMPLALAQLASSTAMFAMFFRLQQIGGPTYLSQIGYVAGATGLLIGAGLLGESYPTLVWCGALLVVAGIAASSLAKRHQAA